MNKICLALLVMVFSGSALAATNAKKTAPVNVLDASKLTTPKTLGYVDPLKGYARTLFPDDAKTVREAVIYLLEPTGYRLITHGTAPYDSNALVDRAIADIEEVRQTRVKENKPFVSGDIEKIITYYADKFNIDSRIIFEIIRQESGFDPNATGRQTKYGTAKGLMQLMDMNSKPHGIDPYNPDENIQVGTALFAKLLNKYQDIELALAAYNAGEGAVDKYGGVPPYKETQNYVKKITERLSDENQ